MLTPKIVIRPPKTDPRLAVQLKKNRAYKLPKANTATEKYELRIIYKRVLFAKRIILFHFHVNWISTALSKRGKAS